jgi:hypothetical protein
MQRAAGVDDGLGLQAALRQLLQAYDRLGGGVTWRVPQA